MKRSGNELRRPNMFIKNKVEKIEEEFYIHLQNALDEHNEKTYEKYSK